MDINFFRNDRDAEVIPNEYYWERIRIWRNRELLKSDWTQTLDAPVDKSAWAIYRQALRDLPATVSDPAEIVFPEPPTAQA